MRTTNPSTGETLRDYDEFDSATVESVVNKVARSYESWSRASFVDRAKAMRKAAEVLRDRTEEYATLVAEEMGKPLPQGRSEVEKCAWVCDYYAEHAQRFLTSEPAAVDKAEAFVSFKPLGVVLAVMPWNFPLWQVFRFAAPNLMAGNGGLLKHAANVQGCALAIEDVFRSAGFPEEVFRTLVIPSPRVADVIRHPQVRAVTLTGSTPAGKAVAQAAGSVLKKTVLELGGSDPYIVLEDADIEHAAQTCVASRLINGGQSCIAAKRFIVVDAAREAFTERVVSLMGAKSWGDPLKNPDVDLGPMARHDLRDELHDQVQRSVDAGARLLLGGEVPEGAGAFYPPTVLSDVGKGVPVYKEETFGPVAAIVPARDEAQAIALANDSPFGLGAAVFTSDAERGRRIADECLEAGSCFVNDLVRSDPRLPFGGIKESGYGRELSAFGIREFVNIKTVYVRE